MRITIGSNTINISDGYIKRSKRDAFVRDQAKALDHLNIDSEVLKDKLGEAHDLVNGRKPKAAKPPTEAEE